VVRSTTAYGLVLFAVIVVSGCGSSSDDPVDTSNISMLEGTWVGECYDFADGDFTGFADWVEFYDGSNYRALLSIHDSQDCSGAYLAQKEMLGTFSVGSSLMTNSGVTAYQMDLSVGQVSVDGQIAGVDLSLYGYDAGSMLYDIFYIDGDNLYFGDYDTVDPSSAENRPTDIDFTVIYVKQ